MSLEDSLKEFKLSTLKDAAEIGVEHSRGDRLALLQALFGRVDHSLQDRLEDMANIVGSHSDSFLEYWQHCIVKVSADLRAAHGPFVEKIVPIKSIAAGFLKSTPEGTETVVPLNFLMAYCQSTILRAMHYLQYTVVSESIGSRHRLFARIPDCSLCSGSCAHCQGTGIVIEPFIVEKMFQLTVYDTPHAIIAKTSSGTLHFCTSKMIRQTTLQIVCNP